MRLYPEVPAQLARTIARDLLTLALLAVFVWVAFLVHDAVDELAVLGRGVNEAGTAVRGGFESAADAVEEAPVVGDDVAGGLRAAGEGSGGRVAEAARQGEERVHRLADLLGILTFSLPAVLLLLQFLPRRLAQMRRLAAARRVLRPLPSDEQRRLLALRAALTLPYGQLLAYTRDPLGDLAAGRYDALVRAAYEDAGLRPRNESTASDVSS